MTTPFDEAFRVSRFPRAPYEAELQLDFDDAETVVMDRPELDQPVPPALPLPLLRVRRPADGWLAELPPPARRVLEASRTQAAVWPRAPRIEGAVARPFARLG